MLARSSSGSNRGASQSPHRGPSNASEVSLTQPATEEPPRLEPLSDLHTFRYTQTSRFRLPSARDLPETYSQATRGARADGTRSRQLRIRPSHRARQYRPPAGTAATLAAERGKPQPTSQVGTPPKTEIGARIQNAAAKPSDHLCESPGSMVRLR